MAPGTQRINHLLFADDCMIFIKPELIQLKELQHLLREYERLAGQRVNQDKSEFMCSPNMEDIMQTVFAQFIGMRAVRFHSKYLGLPAIIGQNRSETFKEVEEKLCRKILDWKSIMLSWAGRDILVKAGLQAQLIYSMSIFKLPKTLCEQLDALILRFWWNGGKKEQGIHWAKKDIVQREKSQGGVGIRLVECLNQALLMKQLWRILTMPESLLNTVMTNKYCRQSGLISAKERPTDSFVWKSLLGVQKMFCSGIIFEDGRWWWKHSFTGEYTVKSGYLEAYRWRMTRVPGGGEGSNWECTGKIRTKFWKAKVSDGVKLLGWRVFFNAIPVMRNLFRRGVVQNKKMQCLWLWGREC